MFRPDIFTWLQNYGWTYVLVSIQVKIGVYSIDFLAPVSLYRMSLHRFLFPTKFDRINFKTMRQEEPQKV